MILITPAEFARRFNISPKTVYNHIRTGMLTVTRIGKDIRISQPQILQFLRRSKERYGAKDKNYRPRRQKAEEEVIVGSIDLDVLRRVGILTDQEKPLDLTK